MKKTIDYIIKSANELPYLKMYLKSFKDGDPDVWESADIKVFANNCTDGTKQWCDKNNIWCEEVNLPGLYSIWNYGASITNNHVLVFSASDFVLAPKFWEAILQAEFRNILYGMSIDQIGHFYHWTGTCIDNGISYPHPDIPERRWYNSDCGDNWKDFNFKKLLNAADELKSNKEITPKETSYCPFLTSREHYDTLNGFNTSLGDYPTDIDHDFIRRGKELDRECAIVNNSFFYHFGKKSLLRRDGTNLEYKLEDIGDL